MRVLTVLVLCFSGTVAASQTVTAPDAELRLLSKGYSFTEGPASDLKGDVYFTDQPNNRIVKYSFGSGLLTDWLSPCGRSNGLFFVAPHYLFACADAKNELWEINVADQSHHVVAKDNAGKRFNGPNDCWVGDGGLVYFTDPLYQRPYWSQQIPDDSPRGVYLRAKSGSIRQVADEFLQPNGIVGDSKKKLLFVADIGAQKIFRFQILADGSLADRNLFCESGSDGMTIDQRGNVYLTGSQGVTIYSAGGKLLETIAVPRGWTSNVTFAGPKNDHLFITASDAVFTIKMAVRGVARDDKLPRDEGVIKIGE